MLSTYPQTRTHTHTNTCSGVKHIAHANQTTAPSSLSNIQQGYNISSFAINDCSIQIINTFIQIYRHKYVCVFVWKYGSIMEFKPQFSYHSSYTPISFLTAHTNNRHNSLSRTQTHTYGLHRYPIFLWWSDIPHIISLPHCRCYCCWWCVCFCNYN